MEKILFDAMVEAIERKNQAELDYLIAKREYEKLRAAYRAYKGGNGND